MRGALTPAPLCSLLHLHHLPPPCSRTRPPDSTGRHSSEVEGQALLSPPALVLFLLHSLGSTETPRPAGSDETHFAASGGISADGRGFADVLVVATSEWVLHRLQGEGGGVHVGTAPTDPATLTMHVPRTPRCFCSTYVHGHTPHPWPAIPLCLVLVVGTAGLQDGLVNAATSGHHTC